MKALRIAAVGAALVFGASIATAQPAAREARPRANSALFQGITLTDAQKNQLQAVRQKYGAERRSLLGQGRGQAQGQRQAQRQRPDSATRAKARDLMQREMGETRALLTADQQKAFDRNVARLRDDAGKHRQRARGL